MIQNQDGTVSLTDVTEYSVSGDSFGAADINATNAAVNALDSVTIDYTLTASGWVNGQYTVSDTRITATSNQEFLPGLGWTQAQRTAWMEALIFDGGQIAGAAYLVATGTVPTINLPIRIIFRGNK